MTSLSPIWDTVGTAGSAGTGCGRFFGIRGVKKKKFRLIQEEHRSMLSVSSKHWRLQALHKVSHTHIGSYRVLGHEGGEKDKNGFPVLPELAAANLKLTAAM